ncbi:MAG: anthranilate synthase component I [Pacificimonas sp.]
MIQPDPEAFAKVYADGRPQMVWTRTVADTETPVGAMLKLGRPKSGGFILESVEGGTTRGRYTMLGFDPDLAFRVERGRAEINAQFANDPDAFSSKPDAPLDVLRDLVGKTRMVMPEGLPPAFATLVGHIGYETIGLIEPVPPAASDGLGLPDMFLVRPRLLLVFDRLDDALYVAVPVYPGGPGDAYERAVERIETALAKLAAPVPVLTHRSELPDGTLTPNITSERYGEMVGAAKDYILAGDVFQVVLAQRFSMDFPLSPLALYRALRRINPSPFLYMIDLPGFALVGSSPEILVRVRDGKITVRPIAGTRPRGADAREDDVNRSELLADPKERAEHLMLLDLGRNDVGRVADRDSVAVTSREDVELYSHVMHIVSNVEGRLAKEHDAIDALMAGFPAGTVSGAPKVRAMQIIAELEPERRGAYAGGVGYFSPAGDMDSCIVLRTAVLKDGKMHVQAGAGIVADSDPAAEQRECEAKAGALVAAAREALARAGDAGFGQ